MTGAREVRVPDIGDFDDVPVIEILVAIGDEVSPEDPLVTLESDKATMDVPAPVRLRALRGGFPHLDRRFRRCRGWRRGSFA